MTRTDKIDTTLLRARLQDVARASETITYHALAAQLQLQPPNTIHQLTTVLEELMREDAAANRPFIAALVVSKRPPYLPGRGFFQCAADLARFSGIDSEAPTFHQQELAQAQQYWRSST
ncbi:MAG TPA: hypothetical protein VFS47_09935 [Steroidobacteraceae bacterium]|nr:hypothetical protein [Steroidobacteraceae bacterium]